MGAAFLKTILYVEDDLHVRTTAKLVLEVIGKFDVRACASPGQALAAARALRPDLILLDVMLSELDGVQLLRQLRALPHLADVPAIFITGLVEAADLERYLEAGVIGVIPKPLAPQRLTEQLLTAWEYRPAHAGAADAPPA